MIVTNEEPHSKPKTKPISFLRDLDYSVVQQCMHCGMCLPTCPTYTETKLEKNSPRGRIALMRSIADGNLEASREFGKEMYYCLGCLACTTACPAGVDYARLFENARAEVESSGVLNRPSRWIIRKVTLGWLFMDLKRLEILGWLIRFYNESGLRTFIQKSGILKLLPSDLRSMEAMTPPIQKKLSADLIPSHYKASGKNKSERKYKVALLTGCAQDLIFSNVNRDTAEVLIENGCDVITPSDQNCCGSLHSHNGEHALAQELARRNLDQFPPHDFDAIISNAGGCGSHLKNYGHLLEGDTKYEALAHEWDRKVKDIHEWLIEIQYRPPTSSPWSANNPAERVTYHHSCHLSHGQKVTSQPIDILKEIPNIDYVALEESQWCCGSAGVYNITQPATAEKMLDRKMKHVDNTCASTVCTGNPGCQLQLQNGSNQRNMGLHVEHPVTLLAAAYRNERLKGNT